jgi:hypothetical protein
MVNGLKMKETNKVFQVKKKAQILSGSSPQGGGQKTTQVRVHLGVQEQPTLKMTPKSHTESGWDVFLYGWKDNFKELQMELVSGPNSFGVDGNRRN